MTQKISQETVYSTLTTSPKTASQIAKELNVARSTPKRHLEALDAAGLARRQDDGWIKGAGKRDVAPVVQQNATDVVNLIRDAMKDEFKVDFVDDVLFDYLADGKISIKTIKRFVSNGSFDAFPKIMMSKCLVDLSLMVAVQNDDINAYNDIIAQIDTCAKIAMYVTAFRNNFVANLPESNWILKDQKSIEEIIRECKESK